MTKDGFSVLAVSILVLTLTLPFVVQPSKTASSVIIVPDDYSTIQEAINTANMGDTIFVKAGTYFEHVVVNKTISLVGEGANVAAISGSMLGRTIVVTADNVTISNLRIENGGLSILNDDCNILVSGSNSRILNNYIVNSAILMIVDSMSIENTIEYNNMYEGTRGIIFGGSSGNRIVGNCIVTSGLGTVVGGSSFNNTIQGNYIKNKAGGWPLIIGETNKVFNNTIVGVIPYEGFSGIKVGGDLNKIVNNTIIVSAVGGVSAFGISVASSNNTIYHNNFFNYNQPVLFEKPVNNTWDNGYPSGGNYWSSYKGTDLHSGPYQNETGRDGKGDNAFVFDENNRDSYPLFYPYPTSTMPWDITGAIKWVPDGKCDIKDVAQVAALFGSIKGDGKYDRRADITGPIYLSADDKIDIRDIALIAKHFGETYP